MIGLFDAATGFGLHFDLIRAQDSKNEALERLSTGKRINRASDDPAGLIAAENIRADITRLEAEIKRGEREVGRLGAVDGALGVLGDLFSELNALVVTAANTGGLSDAERESLQLGVDSILDAIDLTNDTAKFNGQRVLGSYGTQQFSTFLANTGPDDQPDGEPGSGPDADPDSPPEPVIIGDDGSFFRLSELRSGGRLNLIDGDFEKAQAVVESARDRTVRARGGAGARINSIESELRAKREAVINQSGALSSVEDADFAEEASKLVRAQLLEQASLSAILIGRQNAENVLALLRPAANAARPAAAGPLGG